MICPGSRPLLLLDRSNLRPSQKCGSTLSLDCTWGGNRTRTDFAVQQILSLSCLPISTPRQKGAGGRSGYLHGVHFGFTTFSRITGRLIISIRIQDYSFRHTGICREKGIRTLVTIARKHAFQACSISLSDTSLYTEPPVGIEPTTY